MLPQVQSFVAVFKDRLLEELQGNDPLDAVLESVPSHLFISDAMVHSLVIHRTIRKALVPSRL